MSWYKKTQYQRQYLEDNRDFGSVLKKSSKLIEELNLDEILEEFAEQKGYEEALDYVLCSLYPELEKKCREFYKDRKRKLVSIVPVGEIGKMDNIVYKALMVFFYQYQKMLREEK